MSSQYFINGFSQFFISDIPSNFCTNFKEGKSNVVTITTLAKKKLFFMEIFYLRKN